LEYAEAVGGLGERVQRCEAVGGELGGELPVEVWGVGLKVEVRVVVDIVVLDADGVREEWVGGYSGGGGKDGEETELKDEKEEGEAEHIGRRKDERQTQVETR